MYLHITGPLEFLVNNIIHFGPGIYQCSRDDCEATALFDIAGRAKKAFGFL